MSEFFQKMVTSKLVMGIVSLLFGIVLVVWQAGAVAEIIRILGVLLLVGSVVLLLTYFFGRENKGNPSALASAILGLLVGIVFAYTPEWLVAFFPFVMGIVLLVSSVFNLSMFISSPVRTAAFPAGLLLSVLTLLLGIVAIAQPMEVADFLVAMIGVAFLAAGVIDLIEVAALR